MEAMTLEQVRNALASWLGGSEACLDAPKVAELSAMVSAIDAHLAQPAQAVDVGALDLSAPERIWLQVDMDGDDADRSEPMDPANWGDLTWHFERIGGQEVEYIRADLATRALSGEKAGRVGDGWNDALREARSRVHAMALSNGWGTDSDAYAVSCLLEDMIASPTPGKEGESRKSWTGEIDSCDAKGFWLVLADNCPFVSGQRVTITTADAGKGKAE